MHFGARELARVVAGLFDCSHGAARSLGDPARHLRLLIPVEGGGPAGEVVAEGAGQEGEVAAVDVGVGSPGHDAEAIVPTGGDDAVDDLAGAAEEVKIAEHAAVLRGTNIAGRIGLVVHEVEGAGLAEAVGGDAAIDHVDDLRQRVAALPVVAQHRPDEVASGEGCVADHTQGPGLAAIKGGKRSAAVVVAVA